MKIADLFARLSLKPNKASFNNANRMLGFVKKALIGIAAFKSVKWFSSLIKDTANSADTFAKLSKKIGIAIEDLQQWEFAAQISGSNVGQLRTGLQRFARTASDSTRGLKDAQDAFREVGVNVKNSKGELRQLDDMLLEISDRFKTMPDGTAKTALAMRLFGRSGADLIPLLNEGSAGINKLRKEFVDLGGQISGKDAAKFEQFNDDMTRVKVIFKGIRNEIVTGLLPVLLSMVKGFQAWAKENREIIKQNLKAMFTLLVVALKAVAFVLVRVMKLVALATKNWELMIVVLGSLVSALILIKLHAVLATVALRRAAWMAFSAWTKALFPFVLMAAAIAAIVLIVNDLWHAFTGGDSVFRDLYRSAKKWIGGKLKGVLDDFARSQKDSESSLVDEVKDQASRILGVGGVKLNLTREQLAVVHKGASEFARDVATGKVNPIEDLRTGQLRKRGMLIDPAQGITPRLSDSGQTINQTNTINVSGSGNPFTVAAEVRKQLDSKLRTAGAQ